MLTHSIEAAAATGQDGTISLAFELSKSRWLVARLLPGSSKISRFRLDGGDTAGLLQLLTEARRKAAQLGFPKARIVSCYEAGYDGFWLHRWLLDHGVDNRVLDPASIEVPRRARRAKTDKIDLDKLMRVQLALDRGEPRVCSVVHVPTVAQEDAKRSSRERAFLLRERISHTNRIKGLLHCHGLRDLNPLARNFLAGLEELVTPDGRRLSPGLLAELHREHARLALVVAQIAKLEAQARTAAQQALPGTPAAKIAMLLRLKSMGSTWSTLLVNEVFYRDFQNRRQLGAYLGLVGTPYNSGQSVREQGISRAGNARARNAALEFAWLWVRNQPTSALTLWFLNRVGDTKGGFRKSAITALARKLMIALWRYLETGLVPTGAVLRAKPTR
jgi:transposase